MPGRMPLLPVFSIGIDPAEKYPQLLPTKRTFYPLYGDFKYRFNNGAQTRIKCEQSGLDIGTVYPSLKFTCFRLICQLLNEVIVSTKETGGSFFSEKKLTIATMLRSFFKVLVLDFTINIVNI